VPGAVEPFVCRAQRIPLVLPFAEMDIVLPRPPYVTDDREVGVVESSPLLSWKAWMLSATGAK
jgi:hypothetical protein